MMGGELQAIPNEIQLSSYQKIVLEIIRNIISIEYLFVVTVII
jgi:hypothetical protein